ncbi:hypothetical protein FRC14_000774 [Serendipita sp. 396]|nr:hypothetical protein FRC14_000774 [Serendipita sp. 396]KAG8775034.1 hypothetical protein FRC15_000836 [Serendipita sp. 397]KAG8790705.1 hypothetical protein FRC16_000756 [Serendipita sp. 398]
MNSFYLCLYLLICLGSRLQRPSSPIREQPKKNKNTRYLVHDSDDEIENEESENEQYDRTEEDPEQLEDSRTQTARSQANSKNPRQFNRKHQQLELVRREVARQNASNTVDHQPKSSIGKKRKHQQLDEDDEDGENHAFQAGKKFTVHYYMWGNKEQIFGNWEGRNLIKGTAEKHLGRSVQAFKQENLELCEGWGTRKYQAEVSIILGSLLHSLHRLYLP